MPLPHEGVHVRLGISDIHGIGVFAIRAIPKGTNIFENDRGEIAWVETSALATVPLTPAEQDFYFDFGIHKGEVVGCPSNFNHLTPGWYLNRPRPGEQANVKADGHFNFTASRDIEEREELTIDYGTFSGGPRAPDGSTPSSV